MSTKEKIINDLQKSFKEELSLYKTSAHTIILNFWENVAKEMKAPFPRFINIKNGLKGKLYLPNIVGLYNRTKSQEKTELLENYLIKTGTPKELEERLSEKEYEQYKKYEQTAI